ncbi:unnamed protein product [Lactuca saligna]|uniref:Uncharacterized protein n=1 Tax=Lactuca saligna TaxID=75948 RepID=A0AA35ZQH9_LACSI|nr:unnamed protein product [Lactuca saligna]
MCLLAYHHLPIRGLLPPIASIILFRSLTKDLTGGFPPRIATSWFIALPDALTYERTTYISPPPPYVPPEQLTLWVDIPYSATADVSGQGFKLMVTKHTGYCIEHDLFPNIAHGQFVLDFHFPINCSLSWLNEYHRGATGIARVRDGFCFVNSVDYFRIWDLHRILAIFLGL